MQITIRKAEKKDCVHLMYLIRELALYEKAPQEVTVTLDHFVESGFGDKPVWWAFVAEVEANDKKEVVGMALYYIRYSTWKGQRLYLEDIVVNQAWRGKGIGKKLFDRILEECRNGNFNGMMWQVLDWNEPAIRFYQQYGAGFDGEWINCSLNTNQVEALAG